MTFIFMKIHHTPVPDLQYIRTYIMIIRFIMIMQSKD